MAGRKAVPTETKKLRGNPGKRPLNEHEPRFDAASIEPPTGKLPPLALELWNALAPQLVKSGVLKETDRPALEMLCLHYAMARDAQAEVETDGLTADTAQEGIKKHPAASVFREQSMIFKSYLLEFGLTPSSRVRLKAGPVEKEKTLADLLFESAKRKPE